jgi:hypothetical protein
LFFSEQLDLVACMLVVLLDSSMNVLSCLQNSQEDGDGTWGPEMGCDCAAPPGPDREAVP